MAGVLLVYSLLTALSHPADVAFLRTSTSLHYWHTSPKINGSCSHAYLANPGNPTMSPDMTGDGSRHLYITLIESDQLKRGCREGGMIKKKMQLTALCGAKKTHFKISGIYACPFQTL